MAYKKRWFSLQNMKWYLSHWFSDEGPSQTNKLPDDKTLKDQGRGAVSTVTRADGKLCVVKWYDNKPVVMLSTVHSEQPEDTCQVVQEGKKVCDCDMTLCVSTTERWEVLTCQKMSYTKCLCGRRSGQMHFTDLALVNSCLLYRRDKQENGTPRKSIMKIFIDGTL